MPNLKFNQPLRLINNRPTGAQMTANNYGFWVCPAPTIQYASKVLTGNELKLFLAISGQAGKDKEDKPLHWAMSYLCKLADIDQKHYLTYLKGLCKKGFIIHTNFESLEVVYLVSENEYISQNGEILTIDNSHYVKSASVETENKQFPKMEESSQNGNGNPQNGTENPQNYGNNNIYNNINLKDNSRQENSSSQQLEEMEIAREMEKEKEKEETYRKKALVLVRQIGELFPEKKQDVLRQFKDLQAKYGNQYIYYGLKYKGLEQFSMGIGLLFTESYHNEIQQIIMNTEELIESNYKADFLEETEEEKQALAEMERISKMSLADLI